MGKKATKAANNMYYIARYEAAEKDKTFSSREKTSEVIGVERTRLANIELGNIVPYPEEVKCMAKAYGAPELCNTFCAKECPIGQNTVQAVQMDNFDRLALRVLGSLQEVENIQDSLMDIAEDGTIGPREEEKFEQVLSGLEEISNNARALKLWAEKNIKSLMKE